MMDEEKQFDEDTCDMGKGAHAKRGIRGKFGKRIGLTLLALFLVAGVFLAGWYGHYGTIDPRMRSLIWALDTMEKHYYEKPDLDGIYDDLFGALTPDDYSRYYSKSEYEEVIRAGNGENSGIGVSVLAGSGAAVLYRVVGNSPADLAGLKQGMSVFGYGSSADGLISGSASDFLDFANGQTGTFFMRCGYDEESAELFTLSRAGYAATYCHYRDSAGAFAFRGKSGNDLTDVTDSYGALAGADDKTAYIRLDAFTANAAREFQSCLALMKARGRNNLVLDLRLNGGGYMDILSEIASHLMRTASGRAVVATARYRGGKRENFVAKNCDYFDCFEGSSRIKVLADENTASASEALIGAMLDYGTIGYGDIYLRAASGRTYGKGIMQSTYTDAKGNAMKLTVATIHWPVSDTCIQGRGILVSDGAVAVDAGLSWEDGDTMLAFALSNRT